MRSILSARHTPAAPIFQSVPHLDSSENRASRRVRATQGLSWPEVLQETKDAPLDGYKRLPEGSVPSTSPTSRVLQTSLDSVWGAGVDELHPVLLIRDTNAWCPYCERVWLALEYKGIDYDTMLVDLRNKPSWFLELAPKGEVPVAKIKDRLLTESKTILLALEEEFPEPSLLPKGEEKREEMLNMLDDSDAMVSGGFGYLSGRMGPTSTEQPQTSDQDRKSAFDMQLEKLEALIQKHGGNFIMGDSLTLADVMFVQPLERLAAHMPYAKGLDLRQNSSFPGLQAWFKAMLSLPSYQKVRSDDRSIQLLFRKFFRLVDRYVAEEGESKKKARLEAAAKLGANHQRVLDDILKNSGILRVRSSQYGGTVSAVNGYPTKAGPALVGAIDHALRRVCHQLIYGVPGPRFDCKEACAIGSAALVFFRNRASAPRDMSASAAEELREACSEVLLDMF